MAKKTFVIDTNVLLHDPEAILKFPRHHVMIPVTVLEELDKMKRLPNDLGKNSRAVFRFLDSLNKIGKGDLHNGVALENGSTIKIHLEMKSDSTYAFPLSVNDNRIIMSAYYLFEKGEKVVFVSKDFAARIKAEAIGLQAQDYENLKYSYSSMYRGIRRIEMPKHEIDVFYKDGSLKIPIVRFPSE